MAAEPNYPDPYGNLGNLLRVKSNLVDAETLLRRALKLKPNFTDARIHLGLTLVFLGRLRDAKACLVKALKTVPRNVHALHGMGQIAMLEGRFEEADSIFKRVIELDPKMAAAWAALSGTRKMTSADGDWLKRAEEMAKSGLPPLEEVNLRFAMGKYCDDVNDFAEAFQNYQARQRIIQDTLVEDYDRGKRSQLIDDLIRAYTHEALTRIEVPGSASAKPVFVVGMPRSGTSLAEQIIASHPDAFGAGELQFWDRC